MEKKICTAVVLAAGQGKRMGTKVQKQFLEIQGKPVLYYSLAAFERSPYIDNIILVTGKEMIGYCRSEIVEKFHFQKVDTIVAGGSERYFSVWNALEAIASNKVHTPNTDGFVFIHDGARPFVDGGIIERAYEEVVRSEACVVGMPVKDTIKIASEDGTIASTPNRRLVWQIQTPQVFSVPIITRAYQIVIDQEAHLREKGIQITDDAMVVEYTCQKKIPLVQGSYNNIKITTPEDLTIAEAFLKNVKKIKKDG